MGIAGIADAQFEHRAYQRIGQGPVGEGITDQFGVRYDHVLVVPGGDRGRADADGRDDPLVAAYGHPVADPYGALGEQDQAADEVVGDVLQAETDTDTEGAGEDRQAGEVYAQQVDGDQQAQQHGHVLAEYRQAVAYALVDDAGIQPVETQAANPGAGREGADGDCEKQDQVGGVDLGVTEMKQHESQPAADQFENRRLLAQAIDPTQEHQYQQEEQDAGADMQRSNESLVPQPAAFAILLHIDGEGGYEIPQQAAQHQPTGGDQQRGDQIPGDQAGEVGIAGQARYCDTQHGERDQQRYQAHHPHPVTLGAVLLQA